jgi:hypothetical protein
MHLAAWAAPRHDGLMPESRDWRQMMAQHAQLLERRTGAGVDQWLARIRAEAPPDEAALRAWLGGQGVGGYPQQLLVFETFGYPPFLTATSDELIEEQYADRPGLRAVLDRILEVACTFGEVTVQARKGFVALQTPRRKFAVVRAATKTRVDLGLRTAAKPASSRFAQTPAERSNDMTSKVGLASPADVDGEVEAAMRQAFTENM